MNLPNQITLARLVMAVIFCALLSRYDARSAADSTWLVTTCFWLFIVAALSDILDGYLARRHNQVTSLGRILDPFVDKVLVGGAFILLAGRGFVDASGNNISGIEAWMVVLIIGRELFVSSLRGVSEAQGRQYAALMYGKLKMFFQCVTVPWVLLSLTRHQPDWWYAGRTVLISLTLAITLLSMFTYVAAARHILAERSRA